MSLSIDHKKENEREKREKTNKVEAGHFSRPKPVKRIPCNYCRRKFRKPSGLMKHIHQVHQAVFFNRRF